MYNANVLLVDDETAILQLLTTILQKEGFSHITTATSAEEALQFVEQNRYDLMILDVMLPGQSGFDICPIIRQKTDCPIFFLTAKSSDLDKVSGFLYGADDYITKPFNPLEVVARMKAQLRRHMKQTTQPMKETHFLSFGRFQVDKHAAELQVDGKIVECSAQLFQLLLFFCEHPNYVFSKEEIYEKVWGLLPIMEMTTQLWFIFENYVKKLSLTQVTLNTLKLFADLVINSSQSRYQL